MLEKFSDLYRLSEAVREKRLIVKEIKTAGSSRKVNKIQFNNDFKNISCNSKSLSCITRKPILLNTMANLLRLSECFNDSTSLSVTLKFITPYPITLVSNYCCGKNWLDMYHNIRSQEKMSNGY